MVKKKAPDGAGYAGEAVVRARPETGEEQDAGNAD